MSIFTIVVLLAFFTMPEGTNVRNIGVEQHCQCIRKEKRPNGHRIEKVEVNPPNSHCSDTEIIAVLKGSGLRICVDPHAPWLKRVLKKLLAEDGTSRRPLVDAYHGDEP